jgi:type II secretory pathway pseudopilin PulG
MKRTLIAMMLVGGLFAVTMPVQAGKIADRKENQQKRIANGVKSGQLTAGETAHLETKEARLNKEVRNDRTANGGNLTNNEKKQINQQQNTLSKDIYKDKHNSAVQ